MGTKEIIEKGEAILGIEFGSTRIKAVLIDESAKVLATGDFEWENHLEKGLWTYHEDEIWNGLQTCFVNLRADIKDKYGISLKKIKSMGISAMMHGYLAFDKNGKMLVPFRTWRNSNTTEAAKILSEKLQYNIPERWSIAHLYQAVLSGEDHIDKIDYITTLAGYIHWKLTGERVLGVGDASGMFPIDSKTKDYNEQKIKICNNLLKDKGVNIELKNILPKVKQAGENAGYLTKEGTKLLDPTGELMEGAIVAPPEGDAGTGMVATNSVKIKTGNVSAGTSVFAMIVLEKELKDYYAQIDMVTTPEGNPVAMVHANNCTSDINAWVNIIKESMETYGISVDVGKLYTALFNKSLEGDSDCGGLLSYGFISGENIMECSTGRPMYVRGENANFNIANFMRSHIYTAFGALKVGMDILKERESIDVETIYGHGGIFKTPGVAQRFLAAAIDTPVSLMSTAGEGGPWGMAILAAYAFKKQKMDYNKSLDIYLEYEIFEESQKQVITPDKEEVEGFKKYIENYKKGIDVEKKAIELL